MRCLLALGAVGAILGSAALGLRSRWNRPVLPVGFVLRTGNGDDTALAEGLERALEERGYRAGRFRLEAKHVPAAADGSIHATLSPYPTLASWHVPDFRSGWATPAPVRETDVVIEWARARGLKRFGVPSVLPFRGLAEPGCRFSPGRILRSRAVCAGYEIVERNPDLLFLEGGVSARGFRMSGFRGPIFVSSTTPLTEDVEACFIVLVPQTSTADEAGYQAALNFLDALDARPDVEPTTPVTAFDEILGPPQLYEIKNGRFHPLPPK